MAQEFECCGEMVQAINSEIVHKSYGSYYINGKPCFVNDGDDIYDDMTKHFEIKHCPFCGVPVTERGLTPLAPDPSVADDHPAA